MIPEVATTESNVSALSSPARAEKPDESRQAAPKAKPEKAPKVEKTPKLANPKVAAKNKPSRAEKIVEDKGKAADRIAKIQDAKPAKIPMPEPGVKPKVFAKRNVRLGDLVLDAALMVRADHTPETVATYRGDMEEGDEFPPLDVFEDIDGKLYLADGRNRVHAAIDLNWREFPARIYKGTREDAIWFALNANVQHDKSGLRRTEKDKRKAVLTCLAHPRWSKLSARAIAEHLHVSHTMVSALRNRAAAVAGGDERPRATVDPRGLSAGEAKVATDSGAAAVGQVPEAGSSATPESVSVAAPRISDDEYLDRCGCFAKLSPASKVKFRDQALFYRWFFEQPEVKALTDKALPKLGKNKGEMGPFKLAVWKFLKGMPPIDWKRCIGCEGKGCGQCNQDGFLVLAR